MADAAPTDPVVTDVGLPVSVIIVISIGAYMVVLAIILTVRQLLMVKGICSCSCAPCGTEDGGLQCCPCWLAIAESCNCTYPSLKSCMDSVCGNTKNACTLEKCITFQTCQLCCGPESGCECAGCDCACQPPECDTMDCFCFKMQMH